MEFYVQSVVVQSRVYVGGGIASHPGHSYTVMEFDTCSGKWAELPPYRGWGFAVTVIRNQLVLVGGQAHMVKSNVLGAWGHGRQEWTHPYPEMPTARSLCSAIAYHEWLVVAGGTAEGGRMLSSVEVMNTDLKQWYAGPQIPTPWHSMKTVVMGDTCYFVGGYTERERKTTASGTMYSTSLTDLTSRLLHSESSKEQQLSWNVTDGAVTGCAPVAIRGLLFAVGGEEKENHFISSILVYEPESSSWEKVGDLPTPRSRCTCVLGTEKEVLVIGGALPSNPCQVDIAAIND